MAAQATFNTNAAFIRTKRDGSLLSDGNGLRNIYGNANLTHQRAVDRANSMNELLWWRTGHNTYKLIQGIMGTYEPVSSEPTQEPTPEPIPVTPTPQPEPVNVTQPTTPVTMTETQTEAKQPKAAKATTAATNQIFNLELRQDADPAGAAIANLILGSVNVAVDAQAMQGMMQEAMSNHALKRLQVADMPVIDLKGRHNQFELLLKVVLGCQAISRTGSPVDKWPYLMGPAGTGKTTAAAHVAEALGLQFGAISANPQVDRTEFFGFVSPIDGRYHTKSFVDIYRNGGVFLLDEIDAMAGDVLVSVNAAIRGTKLFLPNGEVVNKHQDFILIAGGNTAGKGANAAYTSRQALDGATLDGFKFIFWGYDLNLMRNVYASSKDGLKIIDWLESIQNKITQLALVAIVSPRIISSMLADIQMGIDAETSAAMNVWTLIEASVSETLKKACGATPNFK